MSTSALGRRLRSLPRWLALAPFALGVLIYQSWVVAAVIKDEVPWLDSYVSELAAQGQPHSWVYRTADLTAGLLLVLGVLVNWPRWFGHGGPANNRRTRVGVALIAVAALFTCIDSRFPMSCATSLEPGCDRITGIGSLNDIVHQVASVVVAGATCTAMVLLSWGRRTATLPRTLRLERLAAVMAVAFTLLTGVEGMLRDDVAHYPTVLGLVQRFSIVALGAWIWLAVLGMDRESSAGRD